MRFLRTVWWSPFLTHGLVFSLGALALPLMAFLFLNSRSLALLSLMLTGVMGPVVLARIHGVCLWKALAVQAGIALGLFYTWPMDPGGNARMAWINHLWAGLLVLFLLLSCIQAAALLKRLRFSF